MGDPRLKETIQAWYSKDIRLLALAGKRKTGKTIFTGYLKSKYAPFLHIRIAEAPVMIAELLRLDPTREVLHALFGLNDLLRPVIGESAFKRRAAILLDESKFSLALVESIRTEEEYEEFVIKRGAILVGLYADLKTLYKRALSEMDVSEKRDESKFSFEEFVAKENHPIEREIAGIVDRAHFKIENNHDSPEPFYAELDVVMYELGLQKIRDDFKTLS